MVDGRVLLRIPILFHEAMHAVAISQGLSSFQTGMLSSVVVLSTSLPIIDKEPI